MEHLNLRSLSLASLHVCNTYLLKGRGDKVKVDDIIWCALLNRARNSSLNRDPDIQYNTKLMALLVYISWFSTASTKPSCAAF